MKKKLPLFILFAFIFAVLSAGTEAFLDDKVMSIYPNPAKDFLKIELKSQDTGIPEIRIIDLTGKIVIKYESQFQLEQDIYKAEIDISELNAGIYFVKVIHGEKAYSEKLIVP